MLSHPPVLARPRELWRGRAAGWKDEFDNRVVGEIRSRLRGSDQHISSSALGVLPYRPDLFRRIGPAALSHPALKSVLFANPTCALTLITSFYDETAPILEPSLAGCGESVYALLNWAALRGRKLLQPESFYRRALVTDGYWGLRHAQRTGNRSLLDDVKAWCGDERRNYASAAALFLIRNPSERPARYRDVVLSNPFYAYVSLPHLAGRGLSISPEDVGAQPKWAWHFAQSPLSRHPGELMARAAQDPGWAVELAAARGWLSDPAGYRNAAALLKEAAPDHPLREPASLFLEALEHPRPAAPTRPETRHPVPSILSSGQDAEARALCALNAAKNTEVWRPSLQQIDSPAFRTIVGRPLYTVRGIVRGTIVDSVEDGLAEIKSGSSILNSTYQLRLQTYRSVIEERPLRIYTSRPIDIDFGQWLDPWGVKIEPLPGHGS
jgi:hypothetical protein